MPGNRARPVLKGDRRSNAAVLPDRDLRMVKLQQKLSGCWRTLAGAAAFLALRSYVSTARKQGMNPLAVLGQLFEGRPWLPASAPGPLPAPPCPA